VEHKVLFSSKSGEWGTPQDLFEAQNARWGFTLDVCATAENAKCGSFFTKEDDGLQQTWSGVCWMNPPYGKGISLWMEKAVKSCEQGAIVICLVPSRTDTKWWHTYAMRGEIEFVRGRLRYGGFKHRAPFPSSIIVFHPKTLKG